MYTLYRDIVDITVQYASNMTLHRYVDQRFADIIPVKRLSCTYFAYQNRPELLRLWIKLGAEFNEAMCVVVAAQRGALLVLKLLKTNRYAWRDYVHREAAKRRYHHVLDWLHDRDCRTLNNSHDHATNRYHHVLD